MRFLKSEQQQISHIPTVQFPRIPWDKHNAQNYRISVRQCNFISDKEAGCGRKAGAFKRTKVVATITFTFTSCR